MLKRAIISIIICLLIASAGCSSDVKNPTIGHETLMQVSTIDALMAGTYDGVIEAGHLKQYGDFGLGTIDKLDGEMIELDGIVYQVKSDGVAYTVSDNTTIPFAAVTYFDTDIQKEVAAGISLTELEAYLDSIIPTQNIFYAIRIEGTFSYMKTRSVPAQEKPYPILSEVTKNQSVFEFTDVAGTVVGFRCPPYVQGVNVPGYHLHFLNAQHDAGGHILDIKVQKATVYIDETPDFLMQLPGAGSDFYKLDLSGNTQEELEKVEK